MNDLECILMNDSKPLRARLREILRNPKVNTVHFSKDWAHSEKGTFGVYVSGFAEKLDADGRPAPNSASIEVPGDEWRECYAAIHEEMERSRRRYEIEVSIVEFGFNLHVVGAVRRKRTALETARLGKPAWTCFKPHTSGSPTMALESFNPPPVYDSLNSA